MPQFQTKGGDELKHGRRWLGLLLALPLVMSGAAMAAAAPAQSSGAHSFISDVARHLGVSERKLKDAITQARLDRVRGLLREGKITSSQASEMERRIKTGQAGMRGMHRGGRMLGQTMVVEAATYVGLSPDDFVARLRQGQTPAAVATAQGKTPAGLEAALLAGAQQRVAQAVKAGHLTQQQAQSLQPRLAQHIHRFVVGGWQKSPEVKPAVPPANPAAPPTNPA